MVIKGRGAHHSTNHVTRTLHVYVQLSNQSLSRIYQPMNLTPIDLPSFDNSIQSFNLDFIENGFMRQQVRLI